MIRHSSPRRVSEKRLKANGGKMFSTIAPSSKRIRPNKEKKAKNFARAYGSEDRVTFVKTLPCCACHVVGYSENAHVAPPGEKGTGYKADYRFIVPLCGERPGYAWEIGCHALHDEYIWTFEHRFPDFDPEAEAAKVEQAWQQYREAA